MRRFPDTIDRDRRSACVRAVACLAGLVAPLAWTQERAERMRRIGVLFYRIPSGDLEGASPRFEGARELLEGLADRGWAPGRNLAIFWRSIEGDEARLEPILDGLAAVRVEVIAISSNELIRVAMRRLPSVPIVMIASTRPVDAGLVASLRRPGGNVTGVTSLDSDARADLNGKRLALLKLAAPKVTRVAVLTDPTEPISGGADERVHATARGLGVELVVYRIGTMIEFEQAVPDAVRRGVNGLFVDASLSASARDQAAFHALAERLKLPATYTYLNAVKGGGLMGYGPKQSEIYGRTASFVDRILRGANPAEMPVEQPTAYQLILNLKAARAIGLSLPATLLAQADLVID